MVRRKCSLERQALENKQGHNTTQHNMYMFCASLTAGNLGITGPVAHHELPADDLALLVADGLAVVVHLETGDGFGRPHVGIVAMSLGRPAALLRRGVGPLEHVGAALGGRLLRVLPSGLGHCCCVVLVSSRGEVTERPEPERAENNKIMRQPDLDGWAISGRTKDHGDGQTTVRNKLHCEDCEPSEASNLFFCFDLPAIS